MPKPQQPKPSQAKPKPSADWLDKMLAEAIRGPRKEPLSAEQLKAARAGRIA